MKFVEGSRVNVKTMMGYKFTGTVAAGVSSRTIWVINDYEGTMHVIDLKDDKVSLIEGDK
ncbi:hypothetical protein BCPG3_099 [Bacillus phage BCPG3]|uniref:Uncharacterized protein n=2 Tax=Wphvirus TaxID=1922327 RepID=W5QUI7_9CAUD|nr:hypothetical protein BPS13_0097 [Bacillus phage BPS13]YP_009002982.1 hypothetical protein BPS10C_096 [Bacillus phage BPS10C]AEZ50276.1 hypothetical protein BPS13_0097 [Bacillus phage BPS13]AGI12093.1 hypothetical protein BPS10C_096 [Bacillus phage BPS10C]QSJ04416.1 hypothetical protein BCPG3_099 [Bacillus phage BCPG3]